MRPLLFILTAVFGIFSPAFAQILNPVKWTTEYEAVSNDEYNLIFHATMDDGWAIYSQYTDDGGPIPTSFNFDEAAHYQKMGETKELGKKKEGKEPLFGDVNVIKFVDGKVKFVQRIKVKDYGQAITGYLEFMTCNDATCLPPTEVDFNFDIPKPAGNIAEIATPPTEGNVTETSQPQAEKQQPADNTVAEKKPIETKPAAKEQLAVSPTAQQETVSSALKEVDTNIFGSSSASTGMGGENPVQWSMTIKNVEDRLYEVSYTAKIEDGWHIYSAFQPEGGPIPTTFYYDADQVEVMGELEESTIKREEGFEQVFQMDVIKFKKEASFRQRLRIKEGVENIAPTIDYMVCDKEKCIPFFDTPAYADLSSMRAYVGTEAGENLAAVQAPIEGNIIDQKRVTIQATYEQPLGDCGEEDTATGQSYLWTFILGFLGGLVALLTPCVFPMIPLTVSFFTKGSKDRASGIRNGLLYGMSIIVIYVSLGLLITAVAGPTALNELSTSAVANIIFFLVFFLLAFSFFGFYELTLPSSWANKSDTLAEKGGFIGIFFMAFTLAIVSFSCTGPIIGSAIVASATSKIGPAIVMLGFATALALPFGLFAAFPAWLNSLPRSGSWMNSVKVILGFLELAFAFKFLSVPDMTYGWGILGYELFMGIWILCALGMALYLFGFIKFPLDSPVTKLSKTRIAFGTLAAVLTLYLATGFTINDKTKQYDSLKLLSGYAPPVSYNYFRPEVPETRVDSDIKARYGSFTKCANNLDCFKDYYEGIAYAAEVNKPILLDFTGYGCVNCRKTEEHIWIEDQVWNKIKEDFVLISLYVDDRKKLDKTYVSKNTRESIRNIGKKWSDFQIVNFNQNSQPLYVMMTPEEEVLAKPRGYKEGVESYSDFLECGLKTYENLQDPIGSK